MRYIIITEVNAKSLENVVNEHLEMGLKLQGGVCLDNNPEEGDLYCQAMIDDRQEEQ